MAVQVDMDLVRASFIEDALEHMAALEQALVALEKNHGDDEAINSAFRSVHTLKGSGGIFKYDELIRFAHSLENMLDAVRDHSLVLTSEIISLLFKGFDHLQALLHYYNDAGEEKALSELTQVSNILILRVNQLMAGGSAPAAIAPANPGIRFSLTCKPALFQAGMFPENALSYLRAKTNIDLIRIATETLPLLDSFEPTTAYLKFEILFAADVAAETARTNLNDAFEFLASEMTIEEVSLPSVPQSVSNELMNQKIKNGAQKIGKSIRVDADKLDDFVNLVGELVMKNGSLMQFARSRDSREFLRPISEMSRLVEAVREVAMNLRMIPIGGTFRKMERLVRDLAASSGKEIEIFFEGEDTELDKNIVEKMNDPLVHIIRNAVDHGLEMPEYRESKGKSRSGSIRLKAFHEAGNIVIEIIDDGSGLDYARIREKAIERGLAEAGREYDETEIQDFIFAPGFSTAASVTEISGRGVGMDVVKKNIESMRGTIRIHSESGRGMTLRITLPLTLAIIDGFLVRSRTHKFIIPLEAIKECIDFNAAANNASEYENNLFNLRGEVLPYLRLSEIFALGHGARERESLVVVQHGERRFGIVIDEPLGEYQTVIKPLTGFLSRMRGFGGVTILGMSDLAFILDVQGLLEIIRKDNSIKGKYLKGDL